MKRYIITALAGFIFILTAGTTILSAQDLIYTPKNPAFGGSPINYQWLLNSANTQNKFTATGDASRFQRDPLEDFQNSLQRQILSQLTRDIVRNQFGEDGQAAEESRFEFGEFTIDVTPGPDGVQIRIFNILTGDETSITIPNF
jgi:curli production assembly/transport component CsgF